MCKNGENKVQVTAECLCITESLDMYKWILLSMSKMLPEFLLKNIRIIFADQFITTSLLSQLQISNTCLLHGDPYHIINKVFPETFGTMYSPLLPHLDTMITCKKQEEFETANKAASDMLSGNPRLQEALNKVYQNPSYYTKWHLMITEGTFGFSGSVPAEQNHASIVAHLGRGGNLCIAEHIKLLVERQLHLAKIRQKNDNNLYLQICQFKSNLAGQRAINQKKARETLSSYMYYKFCNQAKTNMQSFVENGFVHAWSCAHMKNHQDTLIIIT